MRRITLLGSSEQTAVAEDMIRRLIESAGEQHPGKEKSASSPGGMAGKAFHTSTSRLNLSHFFT